MGTTRQAFQGDDGVDFDLVVAIEGYPNLLTDGDPDDAVTAWAGTGFTAAIGGLQMQGMLSQSLEAWEPAVQVTQLTIGVMDVDRSDAFAKTLFARGAGVETLLTQELDANDTTVNVASTALFASSGSIHIGTEHITYTGKTATSFTGCTRGCYAPFKADSEASQRFGRAHPMPAIGGGVAISSKVTSAPRTWRGRWIGVWVHRRTGGVLDTRAQAECLWAGRIVDTRDHESGLAFLSCESECSKIRDCLLLEDQFNARAREGVRLKAGQRFGAYDTKAGATLFADDLVVVSGLVGTNEVAEGIYTLDELADVLNEWFADQKAAGNLNFDWTWNPLVSTADGTRSQFRWASGSTTTTNSIRFQAPRDAFDFMGFGVDPNWGVNGVLEIDWSSSSGIFTRESPECPYRIYVTTGDNTIPLEDVRGTWFNNRSRFPAEMEVDSNAGNYTGQFAVLQINGGPMAVFEKVDDSTIVKVTEGQSFCNALAGQRFDDPGASSLRKVRWDDAAELRVKQIVVLAAPMKTMLTELLVSTGTAGYNHADYDTLPAQLGAAMPWEILGDAWLDSLAALPQGDAPLMLVLDKPTRFTEAVGTELVVRLAQMVWKGGALKVSMWSTPAAAVATVVLNEDNRVHAADSDDFPFTPANETSDYVVTHIKLAYNRALSGAYTAFENLFYKTAAADIDSTEPRTIEMRNTYAGVSTSAAAIQAIVAQLAATLNLFARPLLLLRRTIDFSLFLDVAPGDICLVSDDFVRDPRTGERGISNKAGLIVGHRFDLGGWEHDSQETRPFVGEVDILLLPIDYVAAYCPAAEVDETAANAGYSAGTATLTCKPHVHSEATEAVDASRLPAGSKVRIVEIDPDDPASPTWWEREVQGQSGNNLTLTAGLSAPAWDATKRYRVFSQRYTDAVVPQQANVYQADDADGLIQDATHAYEYGSVAWASTFTKSTGSEKARLWASLYAGDGAALDVGGEADLQRLLNTNVSYRTAPLLNSLSRSVKSVPATSGAVAVVRGIVEVLPLCLGPGDLGVLERYLRIAPWMRRATAGAAVSLYVTLCRRRPTGSSRYITDVDAPEYQLVGPMSETLSWVVTTAVWGAQAGADLSIRAIDPFTGVGYLVVEAEPNVEYRGLTQIRAREVFNPYE